MDRGASRLLGPSHRSMPRGQTKARVASASGAAAITRIVIPVYPDFDILDVSGPFAMFSTVAETAGIKPVLATAAPGVVTCLQGIGFNVLATGISINSRRAGGWLTG
jgi:hypothetical protein